MKISQEKLENISLILFLFLLIIGFFFIKASLDDKELKVSEKETTENNVEEKPVRVSLVVNTTGSNITNSYNDIRMNNTNSVLDLFELLRNEKGFTYEKIAYIYGTEVDNINGISSPEGRRWTLILTTNEEKIDEYIKNVYPPEEIIAVLEQAKVEDIDVTFIIGEIGLIDNATYTLTLIEREEI